VLFVAVTLALDWPAPGPGDRAAFLVTAICGTIGVTAITQAFRMAPAAVVAPFEYTALIWASGLGWAVWADMPTVWTWVGAAIIATSGGLLMWLEPDRPAATG